MRFVRSSMLVLVALFIAVLGCSKGAADVQADGCPKDLSGSVGKSCSQDGKSCSGGSQVRMIMCSNGKWTEFNMPPMPQPPPSAH